MANIVSNIVSNIPIPGASILGSAVNFFSSFVKGKTKHATIADIASGANQWADTVVAAFSDFSASELLLIEQKMQPLLIWGMQIQWGLNAQYQPALANSIQGFIPNIQQFASTIYQWIGTNIDSDQPDTFNTYMLWAWNNIVLASVQNAGLDVARVGQVATGAVKSPAPAPAPATKTTIAGISGSTIVIILVVLGIMLAIAKRGKGAS